MSAAVPCQPDIPEDVFSKQMFALVPTVIVLTLAVASYALRLFARRKTAQPLGWDDWLMGVGLLIIFEPSICEFLRKLMGLFLSRIQLLTD